MSELTKDEKIAIIDRYKRNPEQTLNILVDLQFASKDGYIDQDTTKLVAQCLDTTETRISEIVSFYSILRSKPQARYVLKGCASSPCLFTDEPMVTQTLERVLGVKENEDTDDHMFMHERIACIGMCDHTPFLKLKNRIFTDLDEEKIEQLVEDLKAGRYEDEL